MMASQRKSSPHLSLPHGLRGTVRFDEPMSRHTTWRVGGPADVHYLPHDRHDLAQFLRHLPPEMPVMWLGLGSNLLVRDGGIRGAVIATNGAFNRLERLSESELWCDAGVPCAKLAKQCARWHLGPAEWFAGIPGTLGGALAMNAGAYGGETWRQVVQVDTMDRAGHIHRRAATDYKVGYRHVEPLHQAHHGHQAHQEWFLGAQLSFSSRGDADSNEAEIRALLARRRQTQPIGEPSCGSVFTNPPNDHAARLIDSAGLKGYRIGDAEVSTKHANFILNVGTASAADIEALIEHVRHTVQAVHGVLLVPEVRVVGELPATAEEAS